MTLNTPQSLARSPLEFSASYPQKAWGLHNYAQAIDTTYKTQQDCITLPYGVFSCLVLVIKYVLRFWMATPRIKDLPRIKDFRKYAATVFVAASVAFAPAASAEDDGGSAKTTVSMKQNQLSFGQASTRAQDISMERPVIAIVVDDGTAEKFEPEQVVGSIEKALIKFAQENGYLEPLFAHVIARKDSSKSFDFAFYIDGLKQSREFDLEDGNGTLGFDQIREKKTEIFTDLLKEYETVFRNPRSSRYVAALNYTND